MFPKWGVFTEFGNIQSQRGKTKGEGDAERNSGNILFKDWGKYFPGM